MRQGFNLTGWIATSGVHELDLRPPKSSVDIQLVFAKAKNMTTAENKVVGSRRSGQRNLEKDKEEAGKFLVV